MITIYTDGSSRGNPGPGGWAAVVQVEKNIIELGGREEHTTNNRMELSAIREALRYIEERKYEGDIELYTDSSYAMNGLLGWMYGWEKNGWKTGTGEAVLNQDIWQDLLGLVFRLKKGRNFDAKKVAGHSGDVLNERCDAIATSFADGERTLLFKGIYGDYVKLFGLETVTIRPRVSPSKKASSKNAFSYVSCVDGKVHTDKTWDACEKRVTGKRGAKYKKVFSKEEETLLIKNWQQ